MSTWYCNKCDTPVEAWSGTEGTSYFHCPICNDAVDAHPKKGVKLDVSNPPTHNLNVTQTPESEFNQPLYDQVTPYIDTWLKQGGRNEDMQTGVVNFMTGQGLVMLENLLKQARIQSVKDYLTSVYGKQCKTKDLVDFPELAATNNRCMGCEAWELFDEWIEEQK